MNKKRIRKSTTTGPGLMALAVLGAVPSAQAAEITAEFSTAYGRSDNVLRTEDNQISESMAVVGMEVDLEHIGPQFSANLFANGDFVRYLDDAFDDDLIGGVVLNANYAFVEEALDWTLLYNYGQQVFDPLSPITPNNREDISYLTTGPALEVPIGSRFELKANVDYSITEYELSRNDQDRLGGRVSFGRLLDSNRTLSLVVNRERVEYDQIVANPDFDREAIFLRYESVDSRGVLTVDLGVNELELDGIDETNDGTLFRIDWIRMTADNMELRLTAGSRYSDQGDIFRFFQNAEFDLRDTEDVVGTATPFRNNYATANVGIERARTRFDVTVLYSDEDYEDTAVSDREVLQGNIFVARDFSRKVFGELGVRLLSREFFELDRDDRDTQYTLSLGYRFSEGLTTTLSYQYFERSSNEGTTEFNEDRVFLRLSYVPKWSRE